MRIEFEYIKFKNVLSFGNVLQTYEFKNGIDLIVGSNGSGKSTLVDALTYCLFGKPFRKIKLNELINNKNGKNLYTETVFVVQNKRFMIKRGMKPDLFEIYHEENGEWVMFKKHSTNRDYQKFLEESVLEFSENVFRQLVALGANLNISKSFMELSKSEKEEVIQVITDTAIFTKIRDKAKERKLSLKTLLTEYEYKNTVLSNNIQLLEINIEKMERQNESYKKNKEKEILKLQEDIKSEKIKLQKLNKLLSELEKAKITISVKTKEIDTLRSQLRKLEDESIHLKVLGDNLKKSKQEIIVCPSCGFEIKGSEKEPEITVEELKNKVKENISKRNKLQSKIQELESSLENSKEYTLVKKEEVIKQKIKSSETTISDLQFKLEQVESWEEYEIDYTELEKLRKDYEENKEKLIQTKKSITELDELLEIVSDKKLKGIILNQQLPFLNKSINEFLELFDSKFNFIIDETYNDRVVSRNAQTDFNALSNGQKQRISLSVLFAFLKLTEERNGSTNILVLDEYLDSSLDEEGIDEVMEILFEVFAPNKDVILISHNQEIKGKSEKINRVYRIKQKNGFSTIEEEVQ